MAHWIDGVSIFRRARSTAIAVLGVLLCLAAAAKLHGQVENASSAVTTLRVYENLIQLPVVVLGPTMELMRPVAPKRFYVSLDSGPPFQATHVRFEGDDPIALSILIDLSSDEDGAALEVGRAIARMAPASLKSQDRVSVYALRHCEMWRAVLDEVADRTLLGSQISGIKQNWPGGWKKRQEPACRQKLLLLGALTQVVDQSSKQPGRRVVLVVSDGEDRYSRQRWAETGSLAAVSGVAVFGLQDAQYEGGSFRPYERGPESPYRMLCESTGGLLFSRSSFSLRKRLNDFTELLRKRYIVEFPRPDDIEGGRHGIEITIAKSNAFVRSGGISVPIADPKTLTDPNTLRSDPALAPTVGTRKPLGTPLDAPSK